jgi:hypothetical protein
MELTRGTGERAFWRPSTLLVVGAMGILCTPACAEDEEPAADFSRFGVTAATTGTVTSIPAGKIATPAGLVDEACVFEIPEGALLESSGDVKINGIVVDHHPPCSPKQMGRDISSGGAMALTPPTIVGSAWLDDTWAWASTIGGLSFYNDLWAYWTVPSNPTGCGPHGFWCNELLYFFPSLQSSAGEIIQPVLQWGSNGDFGGRWWTLASWYCSSTACPHSTFRQVSAGDSIFGEVSIASTSPLSYRILSRDITTGWSTSLIQPTSGPFNTVQGGVMEVYTVNSCSQFPPSAPLVFRDISIFQAGPTPTTLNRVAPTWSTQIAVVPSPNPACGFGASATTGTISTATLMWHN